VSTAEVSVREWFELTGRGPVLVTELLSGIVRAGMATGTLHLANGVRLGLEVSDVDRIDDRPAGAAWLGLRFRDSPDLNALRAALPAGTRVQLREQVRQSAT
jgi:hypothetical protein